MEYFLRYIDSEGSVEYPSSFTTEEAALDALCKEYEQFIGSPVPEEVRENWYFVDKEDTAHQIVDLNTLMNPVENDYFFGRLVKRWIDEPSGEGMDGWHI